MDDLDVLVFKLCSSLYILDYNPPCRWQRFPLFFFQWLFPLLCRHFFEVMLFTNFISNAVGDISEQSLTMLMSWCVFLMFSCSTAVLNLWVTTPLGVRWPFHRGCILDILHIRYKVETNNFMVGCHCKMWKLY